jgi:hypothetical protein
MPVSLTLGSNTDKAGFNVASLEVPPSQATTILSSLVEWRKNAADSITVYWPVRGKHFGEVIILTARLQGDSLVGQASAYVDMGPVGPSFLVRGVQSCKAGA